MEHGHVRGAVMCNTSALYLHSFRFAGGSLTAAPPPFSENVGFITSSTGLNSYRRENCSLMLYGFNQLVWIHINERMVYEDCMTLFMVWIHINERMVLCCISIWILFSRRCGSWPCPWRGSALYICPLSSLSSLRRWQSYGGRRRRLSLITIGFITLFSFRTNTSSIRDIRLYHFYTHPIIPLKHFPLYLYVDYPHPF